MSQPSQQPLEPECVPTSFHPHQNLPFQLTVKLDCFTGSEPLFRMLPRFCIDHRNLLEPRMEITAYNRHWRLLSFRVLVFANSSLPGARWEPSLLSNQTRSQGFFEFQGKERGGRFLFSKAYKSLYRRRFKKN